MSPSDSYSVFDPREYLRQYYATPKLTTDDAAIFRHLCKWLKGNGHVFPIALDLGCGPTIHYSFALAPYVQRIDLADYLPVNLAAIQTWLDDAPGAHDWNPLFRGVLECEGTDPERLEERKSLYRSRVGRLHHCDLRRPHPLGHPTRYDLVTSFFCAECVAADRTEWEVILDRILDVVNIRTDGGGVFLAAVRNCKRYRVLGREFDTVCVDEQDIARVLAQRGFRRVEAISVPAPEHTDAGFNSIALAWAIRGE